MRLNNIFSWAVIPLLVVASFSMVIIYVDKFSLPNDGISDGLIAIISAFIGVLITMCITSFLLNKQSEAESHKEKTVIQFKKKQDIFFAFLQSFEQTMIKLIEKQVKGNETRPYNNISSLEHLIFQLSHLRVHMQNEHLAKVIQEIINIMNSYKAFGFSIKEFNNNLNSNLETTEKFVHTDVSIKIFLMSQTLSKSLFVISNIFHQELYSDNIQQESEDNTQDIDNLIQKLLTSCGLKSK